MVRIEKIQYYLCKRLRMLSYLTERGFRYEFTLPDMQDPNKLNWMFPRTEELTKTLNEYYAALNKFKQARTQQ